MELTFVEAFSKLSDKNVPVVLSGPVDFLSAICPGWLSQKNVIMRHVIEYLVVPNT